MELDEAAEDWRGVAKNARRLLAVNPLIPRPHRELARAAEHLGERDEAVAAYRPCSLLDDTDPAEVHYRLAKLLAQTRASRTRPAARSSSRSRRRLASSTRIGSCSNWSNRPTRPPSPPRPPRVHIPRAPTP